MDHPITFVLRVTVEAGGRMTGVVERVRTGQKERFEGAEALGPLVTRMTGVPTTARRRQEGTRDEDHHD